MDNAIRQNLVSRRYGKNRVMMVLCFIAAVLGIFFLSVILATLLYRGISALSLDVFTMSIPAQGSRGGLINAIYGTVLVTGLAIVIAAPIGILAATYLVEYANGSKLAEAAKFLNDILLSAPSIIIGVFVYGAVVVPMHGNSAIAGILALALIALPVVNRTTQDMLLLVPNALREATAALGAPRWKSMMMVVYRSAWTGILTGILLAVARISGETAPLLFTAGYSKFMNTDLTGPIATLPVAINTLAADAGEDLKQLAWAGALIITVAILALNILARVLSGRRQ
ncbi:MULTISPECIES: phosphate ABC transporter permease PstA [Rhizobium]|uniref:Phosphate transport system permease protein PstA n=1 Tax=Rhizobium tropici TaxID=398 RepID=A0A6P1CK17_RHITR|nr:MULTISPECIES: phosphate ABC transporter permease PstA [Rhizobium]AGB70750.1 phosphate ABC transporter, permease protein PstA [Rhizobium tropici CIAT 899]MBB4245362.1 phosphate transport system permease protein [Rhizobium tropici]MBB5596710.1 phosphate transport system permease protein [Rhizobium tropici]MBB6495718.1 phosphate transport system permease protein [Rhizobium tropici]NEV15064.1 phosphate ABC transporter permease PstA [Rhizobium tropici]